MSSVAGLGLMGMTYEYPDKPGDPVIFTTAILNSPVLAGPVDLHRREDLELSSALHALAFHGAGRHPIGIVAGDKPDRQLIVGDRAWGTELTQLTVSDIGQSAHPTPREQMAQAHRFRDRLQERVDADSAAYGHLERRAVTVQRQLGAVLPRHDEALVADIANALKEDRGVLFVGHEPGLGDRGMYGAYGPYSVTVQQIPGIEGIGIFVACDFEVSRSAAIEAFSKRVAIKDKPGNEILIVTCAVPDAYGWASSTDYAIFQQLQGVVQSGLPLLTTPPVHVKGILIHESPGAPGLILLNDTDDVPWRAGPGSTIPAPPPAGPVFRHPNIVSDSTPRDSTT
jgi:hypothetical protein